ncbi:UDP-N-acetylmuramoyl-L-alanine--D-glutamate ligase [Aggregatibacter actinomycetemcomitans]|uniref:UDP-N-acetylmuramoyl-L-alanine--D-glutamate ligase n=1 Tax=Aggregatibacter actinomycetemcomitans TaxID=714 RepID=UPI0001B9F45C|nr:UDP-N-acetylmuramoyl-L-alanine--D-glutamate ligase [Aggregatibacter actinomycetemcomitans]AEW77094.1 UDP-N-acetylmuramoyl-L-alanyl-D-glutamate synthetase [Aggregatibacter actinomycetemcomitans ANH9381]ACX82181.1 UDP-N-acetylmuramoyl-L-alanyl-D-glutamate synthetase [Aggregatibacter actinomycetemcomitans D11S-1]KOE53781.1 UDP-N-acetylmuramoyl-L-alanyl-D-glutamate synthetase [Aggregatibacter actinomycetemcomitans serotype b str. I23C]KOE55304.1 UDP-N-acetylmuramoyl-L-alanyl-D-glutamate syntheta
MQYQDKKVTVIGLGKTGLSCVDFLRAKQADVRVIDTRQHPAGAEQLDKAIPLHTGGLNQQWLLESDLIVISPGLAVKTPEIQTALQAGVEVVGDIELFCREADKPIVAITGSNGKSTVTTLVAEMAKAAGLRVGMGGNIGIPALSLLNQQHDLYVLELSSFQLETTYSLKAVAATVLNVTEDHMNRYVDLQDYRHAKLNIYNHCQTAVINAEDALTLPTTQRPQKQVSFGENHADYWLKTENNKTYLMAYDEAVLACDEMKLTGRHNYMNALAAIALAQAAGINLTGIRTALCAFGGLEHRFQVAHIADGVRWINDSKATNVGSTVAALTGLQVAGKLHLLLGGDGKGADFSELARLINQPHIYCYCFGRDGKQLAALSSQSQLFDTMEHAIAAIRPQLQAGDMVLLSPACASLDQFSCFEARGDEFTRLSRLS